MSAAEVTHWRALVTLIRPESSRYGAVLALVAVGATLPVVGPLLLGRMVDEASDGAEVSTLVRIAALFLAIAVASQVVQVILAWVSTAVAWRTSNRLRTDLTDHVVSLDRTFHTAHTPGELVQRIDGDVTAVSDFLSGVLVQVGGAALMLVGMVVALLVTDVRLGVAMAAYVAAAIVVVLRMRDHATDESAAEMSADAAVFGGIEERLAAADDLKGNGAGGYALDRFLHESRSLEQASLVRHFAWVHAWRVTNLVVASGMVLAIAGGASLLSAGWVSIGTVFVAFQFTQLLRRPLDQILDQIETIQKAAGGMRRALDLLAVGSAIDDRGTISPPPGPLDIELRRVSVDYGDGIAALDRVDLRVGAGRTLGLIGRTGSGKTTLSRLVLRQIDASTGTVALGGVAVPDIPMAELRRRVALVSQEVHLLAGSVRDNVALFDDDVDDAAIIDALCAVGLTDLAGGGLDRNIGADGRSVSAGEGQLLALARVWLRDPDVVVLDEATARVDPATEARIEAATRELLVGRTAIVIAHRLSTLERLDDIAVLDGGRLVELGTREDLAGDPGSRYARLRAHAEGATAAELLG